MESSLSGGSCSLPSHDLGIFNLNDCGKYKCLECKALITKPPNRALKCSSCDFSLHLSCLSPEPFITSSKHKHGLVLLLGEYAEPLRRRQCTLCKELCESMFYRCGTCNNNFHPNCVRDDEDYITYSDCITYFMHAEHGLKLEKEQGKPGTCKLCQIEVEELRYQCEISDCKFYMHPACTKFPQFMTHIVHPDPKHVLWLTDVDPVRCDINSCKSHHVGEWYYKCILCDFSRHPRCLATQMGGEQGPIKVGGQSSGKSTTQVGGPSIVKKPPTQVGGPSIVKKLPTHVGGPSIVKKPPTRVGGPSIVKKPPTHVGGPSIVKKPPTRVGGPSIVKKPPTHVGGPSIVKKPPTQVGGPSGPSIVKKPPTQVGGPSIGKKPTQVGGKSTRQETPSVVDEPSVDKNKRIQTLPNLGLRVIVQFAVDKYNFPQALRNDMDQFLRRKLQL